VFSDQQSIHLVELPKFRLSEKALTDPLDVWCYFLVHGAALDTDYLPAALQTPAVRQAMKVLHMLTQNDLERQRYQDRIKAERDRLSFLDDARAEGLEQGLEKGELLGRIHVFQHFLKQPLTSRDELLALPLAELKARADTLEQQVGIASH
jgi:predicted transposase/invertase (TIGR01784 family)